MRIRFYLISIAISLTALSTQAQESSVRQAYNQAENEYNIGRIEQAVALLQNDMNHFQGNLRQSAFRLLALCHLSLDDVEKAEEYTRKLLNEDPYYTASPQDPQRFIDMVENLRSGLTATITTASSQAENLNEVPVPTTLITDEMIRNCGGQNLQEVLAAYVPGMHIIDCNDDINISMRGIYSNGQEKILILLNGHRLNSYTTNIASPDFSISLDKLKQIEVLRGPASSIYGGVALTAVVNLITKQGADVDGVEIRAGAGNYGQLRGDMLFGKRHFDLDLLIWGSIYRNSGEETERPVENGISIITNEDVSQVTIGRIGDTPSYDFGIQLNWKNLKFLYDTHSSQVVAPFTMTTLAGSYNHDAYKTFNGIFPSFYSKAHHADLSYSRKLGKLNLKGALTFDNSDLTHYQVLNDGPIEILASVLHLPQELEGILQESEGTARYINAQELTYGANIKGDLTYINTDAHKGSFAFGVDYSHNELEDVRYQIVYNKTQTTPESELLQEAGKGKESSYNAFVQIKHQWHSLIFNAGLRYDHKTQYDDYALDVFSPRVALIYVRPKWNARFSYSKSFVDAPYLYRKSNDFLLAINATDIIDDTRLKPEIIHSLQLSFAGTEWVKGLNFEVNGFFNKANDLIITHLVDYENGGLNKTIGIEFMTNYRRPKFSIDYNLTWTHTYKAKLINDEFYQYLVTSDINDNNNTPVIMSNVVIAWKASQKLKLFTHLTFESKQYSYNTDATKIAQAMTYMNIGLDTAYNGNYEEADWYFNEVEKLLQNVFFKGEMSARAIVNIGAEYKIGKLTLGLNIHNLFNTKYYRSGMNTKLVPQKGLWLMGTVGYKF